MSPAFLAGYENQEHAVKHTRRFAIVLLVVSFAQVACASLTPAATVPPAAATAVVEPSAAPNGAPTETITDPTAEATAETLATATARPTAVPQPTVAPLRLEVVQSQIWTDRQGNVRVNFLLRNPYDFPVAPGSGARAVLRTSAGDLVRDKELYFLDGISGGGGFFLPGETIAANACFTCEAAPLSAEWSTVELLSSVNEPTDIWEYVTEVEVKDVVVSFDGDSPLFDIDGTVTNNSATAVQRISVRVNVFDEAGKLVGAAEASAWDVPAGATVNFGSYGIGQTPAGPFEYEVSALGVNY
jgi:hypothetical protein